MFSLINALLVVPVLLTPGVTKAPSALLSTGFGHEQACDSLNEHQGKESIEQLCHSRRIIPPSLNKAGARANNLGSRN